MKKNFLPKELDSVGWDGFCVSVQNGPSSTDLHWHDCLEIIHVAKGRATILLDTVERTLCGGDTVILPVGRIHRCVCNDDSAYRIVVGVEEEFICPSDRDDAPRLLPLAALSDDSHLFFSGSDYPDLVGMMTALSTLATLTDVASRLMARSTVMGIYATMYRRWEVGGLIPTTVHGDSLVDAILSLLRERYSEPLTADAVAAHFNISYSNMAKLLSRHAHAGFSELLSSVRVDAAKRLLITTDLSVTDVGYECGFTDTSYFISSFRRRTGTTPRSYRMMAQKP